MSNSHNAVRWVTRTAMGIALIIVAQLLGKVFPAGAVITGPFSVNQLVTGSLVNCVLFVFTAISGIGSGVTIGVVSAMLAQFIGIGPAVSAVSPWSPAATRCCAWCTGLSSASAAPRACASG